MFQALIQHSLADGFEGQCQAAELLLLNCDA